MTPSTSLTLQGFLQGLQDSIMGLTSSLVGILVLLFIARWLIARSQENGLDASDAKSSRSIANKVAGLFAVLVVIGFCINAASYSTNMIPRTTLDRSSINDDMNANIKR